jgi:hypothetical protein
MKPRWVGTHPPSDSTPAAASRAAADSRAATAAAVAAAASRAWPGWATASWPADPPDIAALGGVLHEECNWEISSEWDQWHMWNCR